MMVKVSEQESKWRWERIDPNRTGASGDLSKLFRNEPVKAPGCFAANAPAPEASLLVREAIQNSWDAALEWRDQHNRAKGGRSFEVCFRFSSVSGERRDSLVQHLGLRELAARVESVQAGGGGRRSLGLTGDDCLAYLDEGELRLLEISEQAAGGMHGPWQGDESRLFMAMCSMGITSATAERGGSYGYGKAGLIRGSAIRLVIAYTCFEERRDDPGVTRRLLGMTYWGSHRLGGESYTGSARLGEGAENGVALPFENDAADEIAASLGMVVRNSDIPADLGTTLLLVEPTVTAPDLVDATERYWWPALHEGSLHFDVSVVDEAGEIHHPRPRSNPDIRPFIDAYEAATTSQDNRRANLRRIPLRKVERHATPGNLGLRAEVPGWSYPDHVQSESGTDHRSLIALVRKPRMVVEYFDAGRNPPFVRGTFVADDSINEALRGTEPKGHDAWQTKSAAGDPPEEDAALARNLLSRIRSQVNHFRKDLKPKPKPAERLRLPEFDRIMRSLLGGGGSGRRPPTVEQRPFSIRPGERLDTMPDGRLRLEGTAAVEFSEHHVVEAEDGDEIEVRVRYRFMEDDRPGEGAALAIEPPSGFTSATGRSDTFRGRLAAGSVARFYYVSQEYSPDWTGKLYVDAELVVSEHETADEAQSAP